MVVALEDLFAGVEGASKGETKAVLDTSLSEAELVEGLGAKKATDMF